MKRASILAFCLAALACAGPALAQGQTPPAQGQAQVRVIAVTGQAAVSYKPDWVDLDFSVISRDPSYAKAQSANMAATEKAIATLKASFALKREDVTTTSWSLSDELVEGKDGENLREYVATTRMTARVRDLGAYKAIVLALLDAGVNGIDSISFGVDDRAALREKALVAAYADAERMAKALAAAGKASLGRALQVRENQAGMPEPIIYAKSAMAMGRDEVIASGNQTLEASVYVEFELR